MAGGSSGATRIDRPPFVMFVFAIIASFFATHHLLRVEAAFQDGITGSSFRFGRGGTGRWSREDHWRQSRNLQVDGGTTTTTTSAKEACEAARAREEADIAPGGGSSKCSCQKTELDERYAEFIDLSEQPVVYELSCVDQRCSYCSPDGTTCDRFSYGAVFEEMTILDGAYIRDIVAQVGYFETNQYIVGRPEAVVYTEYNDPANPGTHFCSMEIDNLECAVCEYVDCFGEEDRNGNIDTYYGMNVVCSNILLGDGNGGYVAAADFETCDPAQLEAIGNSQGVFEMYDPDYGQCFTSVEGCGRDKDEMEQTGYYECECLEEDLPTDGISPFLQNVQLRCEKAAAAAAGSSSSPEEGVCGEDFADTIDRTYSSYLTETSNRSIRKDGSAVTIEEFDCLNTKGAGDGCGSCRAFVDGTMCDACEMLPCGGILTPVISCGNAPGGGDSPSATTTIDLCRPETAAGTPFEPFGCGLGESSKVPLVPVAAPTLPPAQQQQQQTEEAGPTPVSMLACEERQREFAQRTDNYIDSSVLKCECFLINETGRVDEGSLLSCSTLGGSCGETDGGSVCNGVYAASMAGGAIEVDGDEGNCFREELVEGFLPDGNVTPMTRTTTYTRGSSLGNTLVGRTLVLTEYGGGSDGCQLLLDGDECASCSLEYCGERRGMRPMVDCTNIVDDPSFTLSNCGDYDSYEDGFLLRLAADSSGMHEAPPAIDFRTCSGTSGPHDGGEPNDPDPSDSDNDNDSDNSISDGDAIDPSLPLTCPMAQPIVLPAKRDDPALDPASIRTLDLTNPNSNFALVSFVASTTNLPPPEPGLLSCAGEGSGSPGLWYSLSGSDTGVHASVCRESTTFEARISVYEGTCGFGGDDTALECVAGTVPTTSEAGDGGSPCNVHWFAAEGKTYYIRVHGSDPSQTGTFNLFLETLDEDVTESCFSEEAGEYDQACLSCHNARSTRELEFPNDPSEIDCRCLENSATGGYHLSCVDLSCLKCNQMQDTCGFGTYELEIQRSGTSPHGSYESFYFLTEPPEGTQASEVATIEKSECLEIRDPYQQCMYAREETMAGSAEVFCECRETSDTGDHMLLCSIYDAYEYCADNNNNGDDGDDRLCATVLFGQSISQYGSVTSEFRNYKVAGDETDDEETSITIERIGDTTCAASIGEVACSSCRVVDTCVNNPEKDDALNIVSEPAGTTAAVFTDLSIDCSNVLGTDDEDEDDEDDDGSFECGEVNTGLLSILQGTVSPKNTDADGGGDDEVEIIVIHQQTIPPDAFPPTSPPVMKPTNPPVEAPSMPPALIDSVLDIADPEHQGDDDGDGDGDGDNQTTEETEEESEESEEENDAEEPVSVSSAASRGAACLASIATLAASAVLVVL